MNLNVSLTDELVQFVKGKVDSGRYTSASEVVREALRLLEKQDSQEAEKLRWLQRAWQDGIESGDYRPLDIEAIKAEGRKIVRDEKLMALDVALARGMSDTDAERVMPLKDAFRHIRETLGLGKDEGPTS